MATFDEDLARLSKEHPELKDKLGKLVEHKNLVGIGQPVEMNEIAHLGFTKTEISLMIEYELITVDYILWVEEQE